MMTSRAVTLEECVDSAMRLNPYIEAAALEVRKARILKGTAFNPPMTEVTLKQETTGGGGPENGVYFGQEFEFPSVYVARYKSLSAMDELAVSRFDILVSDIEREVAVAFHNALYYQELLRLNSELGGVYDEFCHVARARLDNGEAGPLELMNAQRVRDDNQLEATGLQVSYESALLELKRLTGIGELSSLTPPADLTPNYETFDFSITRQGIAASKEVTVAEREVVAARNEFLPSLKVGATVQALIKSFNPYHIERLPFEKGNFMGFEVGITVPLFFGAQSSRLKAATADKRIAALNLEAAREKAQSEAERLRTELGNQSLSLCRYRQTLIPRADEMKRIAKVSYELGDIDYIEYISNIETAYGIYKEYARCLNDYKQTLISLNHLYR